jgi:hypothetical protein
MLNCNIDFTRLHGNTPQIECTGQVTTRDQPVSSISDDRGVLLVSRYPESSVCACMVAIASRGVHLSVITCTPVLSHQAPYQTGWVHAVVQRMTRAPML